MIYERMLKEQKRLENEIQSVQAQLQLLPEGKLICAGNQNRCKWYVSDGHTKVYIPKKRPATSRTISNQEIFIYTSKRLAFRKESH